MSIMWRKTALTCALVLFFILLSVFTMERKVIIDNNALKVSILEVFKTDTGADQKLKWSSEKSPHNFRLPNRLIADYDEYVATKIKEYSDLNLSGNDSRVVKLAQQMMDYPKQAKLKLSKGVYKTMQTEVIDQYLKNKTGGRFVECGGYDGELSSPTVFLETKRGWTGLLVEADPGYYTQLLGKQRNVYSINACLSPYPYFSLMSFKFSDRSSGGQLGRIAASEAETKGEYTSVVPCFPVETLLLALNWTSVDFFALDVEGAELPILKTIPWQKFDIKTLSVEYVHGRAGKQGMIDYMKQYSYKMLQEVNFVDYYLEVFIQDLVFVKE